MYKSNGGDETVEGGQDMKDAILPERWFINIVPPARGLFQFERNHRPGHFCSAAAFIHYSTEILIYADCFFFNQIEKEKEISNSIFLFFPSINSC